MKLGIAGDAFFIFMGIMLLLLLTIPLWYPYVARTMRKVSTDLDDTDRPDDNPAGYFGSEVRPEFREDEHVVSERHRVPRSRAETPQERYERMLREIEGRNTPGRKRRPRA